VAPLVGISTGVSASSVSRSACGRCGRRAGTALAGGEGLLPQGFGREPDRYCVLELRGRARAERTSAGRPAEIADAISAIRLATAAPLAQARFSSRRSTGAVRDRPGAADRGDAASRASRRGSTSSARRSRPSCSCGSALADADTNLAEALDRWESRCSSTSPSASEQLRAALGALLGDDVAAAGAVLSRTEPERVRRCTRAGRCSRTARLRPARRDCVATALVEVLRDGRTARCARLDRVLLGSGRGAAARRS
jgi:hypothetical protein